MLKCKLIFSKTSDLNPSATLASRTFLISTDDEQLHAYQSCKFGKEDKGFLPTLLKEILYEMD